MTCGPCLAKDSPVFAKYVDRIALDAGIFIRDESDKQRVWDELPRILETFHQKGALPKGGRWFSFNEVGQQGAREWWATRMVLEVYLGCHDESAVDDTSSTDIKQLKRNGGGLKLAYLCTEQQYWQGMKILLIGSSPCHEFFSHQASQVKTAQDNLDFVLDASQNCLGMPHLQKLAAMLAPGSSLRSFGDVATWATNVQDLSSGIWNYVTALLAQCSGTMSKLGAPPYSYAAVLAGDARSLRQMKKDLAHLSALEVAENVPASDLLLSDLRLLADPCVRLMMHGFEALGWDIRHESATTLLSVMIKTLPDSKLIEDTHGRLRMVQKSQSNQKMTRALIQRIVNDSGTLEERHVAHTCALNEAAVVSSWRACSDSYRAKERSTAKSHKLPKEFSKIFKASTWTSLSEPALRKSAAAWEWLRTYTKEKLGSAFPAIPVKASEF